MERKFGICAHCLNGGNELEALPFIKEAGFGSTFIANWQEPMVSQLKKRADELELELEFIHAPFGNINDMWLTEEDPHIFNVMMQTIDSAGDNGIPQVILHVSSGWKPAITERGLDRFDRLVEHAREKGVKAAFENLRTTGIVAYFADRYYGDPAVGFCYDNGHEHCYTKTVCWPDIFTTQISCTHIHDNFSRALEDRTCNPDLHMLPFDGTCDFVRMMRKLDEYGYKGSLMLELFQPHTAYKDLSSQEFLKICYERLVRISKM